MWQRANKPEAPSDDKTKGIKNDRHRSRGPREKSLAFLGGNEKKSVDRVGTDSIIGRINLSLNSQTKPCNPLFLFGARGGNRTRTALWTEGF